MTQIICLANSWKRQERCIAGIDLKTRTWIRPVYDRTNGGCIPENVRSLEDKEPQILDVIDIPLTKNISPSCHALENREIMTGRRQKIDRINPEQIIKYSNTYKSILHNSDRYVTATFLKSLPFFKRRTIQLAYTQKLKINRVQECGRTKWKGTFTNNFGYKLVNASITDPEFVKRLNLGYQLEKPCLITVSLSLPFRPQNWEDTPITEH